MSTREWEALGAQTVRVTRYERHEVEGAEPYDFSRGFTSRYHSTDEVVRVEVNREELLRVMESRAARSKHGRTTFQAGHVTYNNRTRKLWIDWEYLARELASQAVVYSKRGRAVRCAGTVRVVYVNPVDKSKTCAAIKACELGNDRYEAWRRRPLTAVFQYDGEMAALIAKHGQTVTVVRPAADRCYLIKFEDGQELTVRADELQVRT